MFKGFKKVVAGSLLTFGTFALADTPQIDLSAAQTSVETAGNAMIGIAVVMLGLGLVIGFIMKRS